MSQYVIDDDIEKKIDELQNGSSLNESELKAIELFSVECAITKIYGSEILDFVVDEGLQLYGGMGFSEEAPMARPYRDARISRIYEGTNEINRMLIVGTLLKRSMKNEINLLNESMNIIKSMDINPSRYVENDHFQSSYNLIDNLKKYFLYVLGKSAMHFGEKIKSEQEVMMNIANVIISIYVMESTIKRCEKVHYTTKNEILIDISKSSIFYNLIVFRENKIEDLTSFMSEDDTIISLKLLDNSTSFRRFNIKDLNEKLQTISFQKNHIIYLCF